MQDNNDVQFCNTTNLDNELQNNLEENGFISAMNSSKKIALEMEIEPVFREKRIIHRKKQFDENVHNETTHFVEESFRGLFLIYSR